MGTQQVEVVSCVRGHHDFHVDRLEDVLVVISGTISRHVLVLVTEEQVSLQSCRGVLGTLAIVAVGQEHHEAVLNVPLGFTRADELVDDDLSPVGEVAELCFPEDEGIWVGLSVTELETENRELRQVRVGGNESALSGLLVSCCLVDGVVVSVLVLVEYVGVSVGEGASLDVLARDSHVVTVLDK